MEPSIIIVNPLINPDHSDCIVFKNADGKAVFKNLKKYKKARILHPLNLNYPGIETIR